MNYEQLAIEYFGNGCRKVKNLIYEIGKMPDYKWIVHKDLNDVVSLAGLIFTDIEKNNRFDISNGTSFEGFFKSCIKKKLLSEMTTVNRKRRTPEGFDKDKEDNNWNWLTSLDCPLGDEGNGTLGDCIAANKSVEDEVFGICSESDERVEEYLNGLSESVRKVVEMKMSGIKVQDIKNDLGLSEKMYKKCMNSAKSYEKTKVLFKEENKNEEGADVMVENVSTSAVAETAEKTKNTSYSIESLVKKLRRNQVRDNHPLQRASGQFNNFCKSELCSDIMQGKSLTQIIISEEIKNGMRMHWLIDGKQRCTTICEFMNDAFAISKNVQVPIITYESQKTDDNGNVVYNDDGFPIPEYKTFDIRKKKFSQLPEELQEIFRDYQVPVMLNLNCTKKEIAYDIARFNRCRPMNVAQNGWTGLEETFAEYVDNILKLNFFKEDCPKSSYRESGNKSGAMRRMIIESIMVINYIDNFNKDFRKMCEFLSEEANDSTFIEFYALVENLSSILTEEVADMFNQKDSFLWFGTYKRFENFGLEDFRFVEFMKEFKNTLRDKEVNGNTFDSISGSTKDKSAVIKKLNFIESLMYDYFGIKKEETIEEFDTENVGVEMKEFVEKFNETYIVKNADIKSNTNRFRTAMKAAMLVSGTYNLSDQNIQSYIDSECIPEDVLKDTLLYVESLSDWAIDVDNSSVLFDKKYLPYMVYVSAHVYLNDVDEDIFTKWLKLFADKFKPEMLTDKHKENCEFLVGNLSEFVELHSEKTA